MSPTEDELRAALRSDEGQALDPDTVIRRARAHGASLREQRIRIASAAAVVVVVAGLGVGGGFVLGRHTESHTSSGISAGSAGGGDGGTGGAMDKANPTFSSPGCPSTLPQDTTAQGPNPRATFFTKPVAQILVCAYAIDDVLITGADGPITTTLTGAAATALANSIEHAAQTQLARPCPLYRTTQPTLLMKPTATDGTPLPNVTTTVLQNPCNATITNGAAVRYNWLPTALGDYIARLGKAVATPTPQLPTHT